MGVVLPENQPEKQLRQYKPVETRAISPRCC
jgi:hypothetical protein